MPRLENLQTHAAGHFGFSAARIEDLGASEYTLVTIVADRSGSTSTFQKAMESCLKTVLEACRKSPRCDNLMLRLVTFDSKNKEEHGFRLLMNINPDEYDDVLKPGGMTALFDAAADGIEGMNNYGRQLMENDFTVNGVVFVITDGDDTAPSTLTPKHVRQALAAAVSGENLESLVSVLIAVNMQEQHYKAALESFQAEAQFTQFIDIGDATPGKLAKLAEFVSKSISSQSQALGSGAASQSINF